MSQLFDYFVVVGLVPLPPSPLDDDEDAVTFMPQVIDRYPIEEATDRCGYELPPTLPFFAIPEGALRTAADGKSRNSRGKTQDRFFTFVLTDGAGASYYGGCLQRFYTSNDGGSPLPRSMCVLSRIPAYLAFRDVLVRLHVLTGGMGLNTAAKPFLQSFFNMAKKGPGPSNSIAFKRGVRMAPPPEPEEPVVAVVKEEQVDKVESSGWVRGMSRFIKSTSKREEEAEKVPSKASDDKESKPPLPEFVDVVVPEVLVDGKVSVKSPDGRQLQVQVPANAVAGTTLRIPIPPPKPKIKMEELKPPVSTTAASPPIAPSPTPTPSAVPTSTPAIKTPTKPPSPVSGTNTLNSKRKKQTMLMDLMTRRTEVVVEDVKDLNQEWEFLLLRVVFSYGVIGIEINESTLREVPMKYHHAAQPDKKTSSVLQDCHLQNEKLGHRDSERRKSSASKDIGDETMVAYVSAVEPDCAASFMGFEAGDIIVEINDVPIRGDSVYSPAQNAIRCIDSTENCCITVLKRKPHPGNVLQKANPITVPLENIVSYMIDYTPIPPRGADLTARISEGMTEVKLSWSHGEVSPLPFIEPSCFAELAQALESRDVVTILEALLQEQRVCILSSDVTQLTPVCEALRTLMYPLKWQHAYIPLLPKELLGYLEAPIPFVVGLDQSYLDDDPMVAEAVECSGAVTVRLNQKHALNDEPWSDSIHVPDDIHFVSMSQPVRLKLIKGMEEAFTPFRTTRKSASTTSAPAASSQSTNSQGSVSNTSPSKAAASASGGYWRLLGGSANAQPHSHPLSLNAATCKTDVDISSCWRSGSFMVQHAAFHAIAEVLNGYNQFLKSAEASKAVEEGQEIDPGAFFDRDAFMCHHRSCLMNEDASLRESEDEAESTMHVAPLSAKFAENVIHTQLFEAFIEESSLFEKSPEIVYFNQCCEGILDAPPTQRKRPTLSTSPMKGFDEMAIPTYYCYCRFPRLDGSKLRRPPQCEVLPQLIEPEEAIESHMDDSSMMVNLDRSSPPLGRSRALSRQLRNSQEWNQTTDVKPLFGQSSIPSSETSGETSEGTSEDEREKVDADFYEHDFKVFTRDDSDLDQSKQLESPAQDKEQVDDESTPSKLLGETPTQAASRWSRVSNFSLKSASQAAAVAASASVSAVNLASAAAAKASAAAKARNHAENKGTTSTPTDEEDIPIDEPSADEPSVDSPLKTRPPLTKWDPSQARSLSDGRSSLWDKSALALDNDSRNRFNLPARRRSSETSLQGAPISSPPLPLSKRGSLKFSDVPARRQSSV